MIQLRPLRERKCCERRGLAPLALDLYNGSSCFQKWLLGIVSTVVIMTQESKGCGILKSKGRRPEYIVSYADRASELVKNISS